MTALRSLTLVSTDVNAFVGECRSLLFGVGLQDYHAKHPNMLVPLIVQRWCVELALANSPTGADFTFGSIANVEATGLDQEGIYRVPGAFGCISSTIACSRQTLTAGKLATIQQIVHRMEKGEEAFEFGPNDDPPAVAGVLKVRSAACWWSSGC